MKLFLLLFIHYAVATHWFVRSTGEHYLNTGPSCLQVELTDGGGGGSLCSAFGNGKPGESATARQYTVEWNDEYLYVTVGKGGALEQEGGRTFISDVSSYSLSARVWASVFRPERFGAVAGEGGRGCNRTHPFTHGSDGAATIYRLGDLPCPRL